MLDEPIKWRTALLILIFTGMRRGELMGLEWKDIDYANKLIHIRRTSQYISGQGILTKEPKNRTSERVLKVTDDILNILIEYKSYWELTRFQMGDRWQDYTDRTYIDGKTRKEYNDRLFVTEDSTPMHPDSLTDWTAKFVEKHNLPHFSPHSLRHTNITLQIAAGVPLSTVSKRAGHAQTSTTSNIYAHAIKTADEKAAEAISSSLSIIPKVKTGQNKTG